MNKTNETKQYNVDEVKDMAEHGYIPPRTAAALAHVRVDRVYRAMKPRTLNGKEVKAACRIKLSENGYNRYIHKADWLAYIAKVRARVKAELGLSR
jgi:hypothetical protein